MFLDRWDDVFGRELSRLARDLIFDIRRIRNRWAHHEDFADPDTLNAVYTTMRLLEQLEAAEASTARQWYEDSIRSPQPEGIGAQGGGTSPPPAPPVQPDGKQAQRVLQAMVARAGGPSGSSPIPVDHLPTLKLLFNAWAARFGEHTGDGIIFRGRPGLWHALDQLVPLTDTNRWDGLRKAVLIELEAENWERVTPPRGSVFLIHEPVTPPGVEFDPSRAG